MGWPARCREGLHGAYPSDLTVACSRPLEGEWVCLDAVTARDPAGIGLTETRLWDLRGPIGRALQPLVIEPREA